MKFFILLSLFLLSCASPLKMEKQQKVHVSKFKQYKKLKFSFFKTRNKSQTIKELESLSQRYPQTDLEEKINHFLGKYYYESGLYKKAYTYFSKNFKFFPTRNNINSFILGLKSLEFTGNYKKLQRLSKDLSRLSNITHSHRLLFLKQLFRAYKRDMNYVKALEVIHRLMRISKSSKDKSKFSMQAIHIVEMNLTQSELEATLEDRRFKFVHDFISYRLGLINFEKGKINKALVYFEFVNDSTENAELSSLSKEFIENIEAQKNVNKNTIGVILPLSGKYKYIGRKVLQGIQLGLGIFGKNKNKKYRLIVRDDQGSPFETEMAFKEMLTEHKPIAIVGGVLSKSAIALARFSHDYQIPVFVLSQKSNITKSPYVFRSGLISSFQVKWLVKAALDQGKKRFAVLFPNDFYGVEYANAFWDEVLKAGGEIKAIQPYHLKKHRLSDSLNRLLGVFYMSDRLEEYTSLLKQWFSKVRSFSARTRPPKDLLPYKQDFDTLFIPDTAKGAFQVVSQIQYYRLKDLLILGTNAWALWDKTNKKKLKQKMAYVDNSQSHLNSNSTFYKVYKRVFSERPHVLSAHAYDIAHILRIVLDQSFSTRTDFAEMIRNKRFQGVLSKVQIDERGEFTRNLSLFESEGDGFIRSQTILKLQ